MGIDYRLLSFSLKPHTDGAESDEQHIINIDCRRQIIRITCKEVVKETISFAQIQHFCANEDGETFRVDFTDSHRRVFTLESELDRDDIVTALTMAQTRKTGSLAKRVGVTSVFEGTAKQKGKFARWSDRWLVLVSGRLLIFRSSKSETPLAVISLSETMPQGDPHKPLISMQTLYHDYTLKFDNRTVITWLDILEDMARMSMRKAQAKKMQREQRRQSAAGTGSSNNNSSSSSGNRSEMAVEEAARAAAPHVLPSHVPRAFLPPHLREQLEQDEAKAASAASRGRAGTVTTLEDAVSPELRGQQYEQAMTGYHNVRVYDVKPEKRAAVPLEEMHDMSNPFEQTGTVFDDKKGAPVQSGEFGAKLSKAAAEEEKRKKRERKKREKKKRTRKALDFVQPIGDDDVVTVHAWGCNCEGQLGNENTRDLAIPQLVDRLASKKFRQIAPARGDGASACFGVTKSGKCFAWGSGHLGLSHRDSSPTPYLIATLKSVRVMQVCASASHAIALDSNHNVFAWGEPELTGHADFERTPKVCRFVSERGVTRVACGPNHTLAAAKSGELYAWGRRGPWLGLGKAHENSSRMRCNTTFGSVRVPEGSRVKHIACGLRHSLACTDVGSVYSWGEASQGRLGLGEDMSDKWLPKRVQALGDMFICAIDAGKDHSACISDVGLLYTWGCGADLKLGHGSESDEWEPRLVSVLDSAFISKVACLATCTYAVANTGALIQWGTLTVRAKSATSQSTATTSETTPFPRCLEYLRGYRVYELYAAYDAVFADTVLHQGAVPKPVIHDPDYVSDDEVRARLGLSHKATAGSTSAPVAGWTQEQRQYRQDQEIRRANLMTPEMRAQERETLRQMNVMSARSDRPIQLRPKSGSGQSSSDQGLSRDELLAILGDVGVKIPGPPAEQAPPPAAAAGVPPPPPPPPALSDEPMQLTVVLEEAPTRPIGFVMPCASDTMRQVRLMIDDELDLPAHVRRYVFVKRGGVPLGVRQEERVLCGDYAPTVMLRQC